MSFDGIDDKLERVSLLKEAGSGGGEQACSEHLSLFGSVTEADLAPLDCRSDPTFGRIIGRLNAVEFEEGEQMGPRFEQSLGQSPDLTIRAMLMDLETPLHSSPYGNRLENKGLPIRLFVSESVPESEHAADFLERPFGELHGIRTPTRMLDAPKISYNVSPADLSDSFVECVVGAVSV